MECGLKLQPLSEDNGWTQTRLDLSYITYTLLTTSLCNGDEELNQPAVLPYERYCGNYFLQQQSTKVFCEILIMNIVTNKNEKMSLLLLSGDWGIRNEPLQSP